MSVIETTLTTRDILHRAADLLSEWDWCQGDARCGDAICAEGAIWFALTGTMPDGEFVEPAGGSLPHGYREACVVALQHVATDRPPGLYLWNDMPGRNKAEVIALLRKSAEESS